MPATDREKAPIHMKRSRIGLVPASAIDAEMLDRYAVGAEVEVSVRQRRSSLQLRYYWVGLGRLVEAMDTGYPTAERLHEALKMDLNYVEEVRDLRTGRITYVPDSIAFSRMDAAEFRRFFDLARARIVETYKVDPWDEQFEVAA